MIGVSLALGAWSLKLLTERTDLVETQLPRPPVKRPHLPRRRMELEQKNPRKKNCFGRLTSHTRLSHIATPYTVTVRCIDVLIHYA